MLLNIHSHHAGFPNETVIRNLTSHYETVAAGGLFSLGIHPGFIEGKGTAQWESLKQWARQPQVVAIGECGLDKRYPNNWTDQLSLFRQQIQLAVSLGKPLILHCVKAWEEVFSLLKTEKITVPVIFHGFNKTHELAVRITREGYYLSFGKALEKEGIRNTLAQLPADRFFLETDDALLPIASVYEWAASALGIDQNSLSLQIQKNAAAVWGPSLLTI